MGHEGKSGIEGEGGSQDPVEIRWASASRLGHLPILRIGSFRTRQFNRSLVNLFQNHIQLISALLRQRFVLQKGQGIGRRIRPPIVQDLREDRQIGCIVYGTCRSELGNDLCLFDCYYFATFGDKAAYWRRWWRQALKLVERSLELATARKL